MRRTHSFSLVFGLFLAVFLVPIAVTAQVPLEQIVPASAKGFLSVPNLKQLEANWEQTELSKMFEDEEIRPFVEDVGTQVDRRLSDLGVQIGITLDDLREVCTREAAIAFFQPDDQNQRHAMLVLIDATGQPEQLDALMRRIDESMTNRKATNREASISDVPVTIYTVPVKGGVRPTIETVIIRHGDLLVATDHVQVAQQVVPNLLKPGSNALVDLPAFKQTMERCLKEANGNGPDVRWFVEPLGYAEIARDFSVRKKRRTDILKALRSQGFDAVQGVGGILSFIAGDHEIESHAYAYAPPVREAEDAKYLRAAGMMAYPVVDSLAVQDWVPDSVSSYVTARWDIQKAFSHVGQLVDEVAGEPGFFEDLIDSLKNDPNGPRIDLKKEIVAYFGNRVTIITNTTDPITISSERLLIAIELIEAEAMKTSLQKMLENDPVAKKLEYNGHVIWEIVNEEEELGVVTVEGLDDFGDLEGFENSGGDADDDEAPFLANAALSVVKGHLVISSHSDFVKEMIDGKNQDPLGKADDFQHAQQKLVEFGQTEAGGMLFSRCDRELRASYELVRMGKMPESEGLIGRALNRVLGSGERGVVRKQEVDVDKMPKFEVVQKYLGPISMFIRTEDEGWYVGGLGLKQKSGELQGTRPALTTAAADDTAIEN